MHADQAADGNSHPEGIILADLGAYESSEIRTQKWMMELPGRWF